MKKISISIILFMVIIINCGYNILAYSTSEYSIDIPTNYKQVSENSFTDENGKNINIQIVPFGSSSWDDPYSEKHLDELVNGFYTEIDNYREEFKNTLREKNKKYNAGLTEEEIEEYAKSFKVDSIEKKEVITFSKNNYKGFHIVAKYVMGEISTYADQYTVESGKKIYTLTISCSSLDEINSNKKIVDSFTINNFQRVEGKEEKVTDKVLTTIITALIVGGLGALIGKFNSNKKNDSLDNEKNTVKGKDINVKSKNLEEERETKEIKTEEFNNNYDGKDKEETKKNETGEANNKEEKKFCTKCGNEIEETWDFCNNCGNKLK